MHPNPVPYTVVLENTQNIIAADGVNSTITVKLDPIYTRLFMDERVNITCGEETITYTLTGKESLGKGIYRLTLRGAPVDEDKLLVADFFTLPLEPLRTKADLIGCKLITGNLETVYHSNHSRGWYGHYIPPSGEEVTLTLPAEATTVGKVFKDCNITTLCQKLGLVTHSINLPLEPNSVYSLEYKVSVGGVN